jgi:hypothetical protein
MKKLIASMAVAVLAGSLLSGAALAAKKAAHQHVDGHILMQAPPSDATDNPNGCYSGVHRRSAVATQEQVNGVVGFHFDVDPGTWKKKFRLAPAEGEAADIDITFYSEFGTPEQATDTAYAPVNYSFEERNEDGEFGKVPVDVTKAIVCMKVGQDVDFTYMAGKGVK